MNRLEYRLEPWKNPESGDIPFIPDHRLFGLIASGAYGEVWLACNAVGTLRAVKVVRRDQHTSVESFEREFNQRHDVMPSASVDFAQLPELLALDGGQHPHFGSNPRPVRNRADALDFQPGIAVAVVVVEEILDQGTGVGPGRDQQIQEPVVVIVDPAAESASESRTAIVDRLT